QMEKIKGNAKPAADPAKPPPAKPATGDDLAKQLAEAQRLLAELQGQRILLKLEAEQIDAQTKQVADLIQKLESERSKTAPAAKGALLEVSIIDEKGLWPFTIKEYDA